MGQLDDKWIDTDFTGHDTRRGIKKRVATGHTDSFLDNVSVTDITSRDQIIDPYQVVNEANYRNSIRGRRAYESDLARAMEIQKQQMASYEEWYNSPEQAAIRERAAGLNPDLAGLDNAGSAASPDAASATPGSELPTTGQNVLDTVNSVMSIMQTLGSLSALPLQFQAFSKSNKLVDKQIIGQELLNQGQQLTNDGISLGNITAFEQLAHRAISDKYATYHSNLLKKQLTPDVAAFFADDANFEDIIPSYAPSDNPMYQNALSRVRKGSESIIADAYSISSDKVNSQSSVARILANPWYDDDTKLMVANLSPIMDAIFELEKSTFEFNKQVVDFKKTYVGELNAETLAENYQLSSNYQRMILNHQQIIEGAKSYVYTNLRTLYENEPTTPAGFRAGCLIMGQAPSNWADFLTQYLANLMNNSSANGYNWNTNPTGTPGVTGPAAGFIPPGTPRFGSGQ